MGYDPNWISKQSLVSADEFSILAQFVIIINLRKLQKVNKAPLQWIEPISSRLQDSLATSLLRQ